MKIKNKNVSYTNESYNFSEISKSAQWLWLDPLKYPEYQKTPETVFVSSEGYKFCVAEFCKSTKIPEGKNPVAHINIFADTKFRLYINGEFTGTGPVAAGGDYGSRLPMPKQYFNRYTVILNDINLDIFAQVHTIGAVMTDYSCGHGGFIMSCKITYDDREDFLITTDSSWLARINPQYKSVSSYDASLQIPEWEKAYVIKDGTEKIWNLSFADIPMLTEEKIHPCEVISETRDNKFISRVKFDKIYSAYVCVNIIKNTPSPIEVNLYIYENFKNSHETSGASKEFIRTSSSVEYRGLRMQSAGEVTVTIDNLREGEEIPQIEVSLIYTHYPYDKNNLGSFECSDAMLNQIYSTGKHTLEICRQTLHLDSPNHQETLGCTGDYAIESILTHATYGDMRLSALDIIRTADYLVMTDGYMFHTSYSLIWVHMVLDYYIYTKDSDLAEYIIPALDILMNRFEGYKNESGIIDHPINYMFIDWANVDGFTMHHPPKSLGQTCMNAFYNKSLCDASELYKITGNIKKSEAFRSMADEHKKVFNQVFYDTEKQIYFDGLTDKYEADEWIPENTDYRYYTRHSNTLAVLYGFIEGEQAKKLMERVITEDNLVQNQTYIEIQPYFMHYVMEAAEKTVLFEDYGLNLIHLWDKQIIECKKGLKEGWGEFRGDYSHAWGATPVWALPARFLGFEMIKPGFEEISLTPKLFGDIEYADISFPTPYGCIRCSIKKGELPHISVPDEINAIINI